MTSTSPYQSALDRYTYFTKLLALSAGRLELLTADLDRIDALPIPEEAKPALRKTLQGEMKMWEAVGQGFGVILTDIEQAFPELQADFKKLETEIQTALYESLDRLTLAKAMGTVSDSLMN